MSAEVIKITNVKQEAIIFVLDETGSLERRLSVTLFTIHRLRNWD